MLALLLPLGLRGRALWLPVLLIAAEFMVAEASGRLPASSIVLYATGLITVCELVLWPAGLPPQAEVEWDVVGRRLIQIASFAGAGALLSAATLLPTFIRLDSAILAALLGGAAAIGLLAIPWLLVRRPDVRRPD